MSWCWRPSSRRTARCWAWTHATVWTGSSRLPTDKRDHQARCASSAARTGATSPTCGVTTIAARPRRHIHHLKSARSAAKKGCGNLVKCSMFREAQVVVWRYGGEQQGNPRTPRQRWQHPRKRLQRNAKRQSRAQRHHHGTVSAVRFLKPQPQQYNRRQPRKRLAHSVTRGRACPPGHGSRRAMRPLPVTLVLRSPGGGGEQGPYLDWAVFFRDTVRASSAVRALIIAPSHDGVRRPRKGL